MNSLTLDGKGYSELLISDGGIPTPAVPIANSVAQDYIVCLEDGKRVKLLHRYLRTRYRLSPAEYRKRWDLPGDYPMVAPAYSESRRAHAIEIGFKSREARPKAKAERAAVPAAKTAKAAPAAKLAKAAEVVNAAAAVPMPKSASKPKAGPASESAGRKPRRKLGIVTP